MKKLILHGLIEKEGDKFSALCLELDVASQGDTTQEAKGNLKEAIELYLQEVSEAGDKEEFIPRPAPQEEWIKYFKAEAAALGKRLSDPSTSRYIELEDVVYA